MSAGRHDFRDPIRLKPGERQVSYPYGDTAYPRIAEGFARRKGDTSGARTPLSRHPDEAAFPNAFLTQQISDKGDDAAANVTRIYETLPGPLLAKPGFNSSLGNATTEYRQRVALPASAELIGTVFNGQVVVDSFVDPEGSTVAGTLVIECWSIPPSRTERESIGYEFPAQFNFITGWLIPVAPGYQVPGPFPGVNFTLSAHRTLSTPATVAITYSNGPTTVSETVYSVTTPGKADRYFGIGANTIHNAIFLQETETAGTQTVENLPASTPSSYTPGTTLTIRVSSRLVMGTIWEKRVTTCAEQPL